MEGNEQMSAFTRKTRVGTTVLLGIVLTLLGFVLTLVLATGLAFAQQGVEEEAAGETVYLVLDTALPLDDALSAAVDGLYSLQKVGLVIGFNPKPQTSGPNAVAALEVTVTAGQRASLSGVPGSLAVVDALPLPPAINATLQATTLISGHVTDLGTGAPIDKAEVIAYDGLYFTLLQEVEADATGYYTITANPASSGVKLRFSKLLYTPEFYNDKPTFATADTIVADGADKLNTNAALVPNNGMIVGTLTFTPTGQPVVGAFPQVFHSVSNAMVPVSGTVSNQTGTFTVTNLAPGGYKLLFAVDAPNSSTPVPVLPEYFADKANITDADVISVTNSAPQTISAVVEQSMAITGTVIAASNDQPLRNVPVNLYHTTAMMATEYELQAFTNNQGQYVLPVLEAGQYAVRFGGLRYAAEFYDNVPGDDFQQGLSQATVFSGTAGQTVTNINAALDRRGAIVGTLIGATGVISGEVFLGDDKRGPQVDLITIFPDGKLLSLETVRADPSTGVFTFSNLSEGNYKLYAGGESNYAKLLPADNDEMIIPHAPEWYNDGATFTDGLTITVQNEVTETVDIQLDLSGCIQGKIVSNLGQALNFYPFRVLQVANNYQSIEVFDSNPPFGAWDWDRLPATHGDDTGSFHVCGLPAGEFVVTCDDPVNIGEMITVTVAPETVVDAGTCMVTFVDSVIYLPLIFR
jgi:hypothetical protein